jgi:threonylcarbamoyladenosine tRNA methylthiotransferase MtaB
MRRRYLRELYAEKVTAIKQSMPHACIGVDVITGFPGETENDFIESLHFLSDLDISYLHVFTYSERDGTPAAGMNAAVPYNIRKERTARLRMLSTKKLRSFYSGFSGTVANVLMEAEDKSGMMFGYSENYIRVKMPFDPEMVNSIVPVVLGSVDSDGVMNAHPVSIASKSELCIPPSLIC